MAGRTGVGCVLVGFALAAVVGCGDSSSVSNDDSPDATETPTATESATATETPTETESTSTPEPTPTEPAWSVVIEEDFTNGAQAFATGKRKNFSVTPDEGGLELFTAGLGTGTNNSVYTPAALPAPAQAVRIEAVAEFRLAYGVGVGGYGMRCNAGDGFYQVVWDNVVGVDDAIPAVTLIRYDGTETQELDQVELPPVDIGNAKGLLLAMTCVAAESGATTVSLDAVGEEALTYTDEEGLGPFDVVSLYGQWDGEKIPPNDYNPQGGGFTFAFDDVVVSTG